MKKKKKIGKPWALLYYLVAIFMYPVFLIKHHVKIKKIGYKSIKGPALILSQHLSGQDHLLPVFTFFPRRITFVGSEHFLLSPSMRRVFKLMHVITKKMFCADVSTIVKMSRAKEEGNLILIFPEGRLPANGISVPVTDGTAALAKKLGIDVYFMRSKGIYHAYPKWGKSKRRGPIEVESIKVLTKEQLCSMSVDEIDNVLQKTFMYNEDLDYGSKRYPTKDTTLGLNELLWKCPKCKSDWNLTTENNHVRCACGYDTVLKDNYEFDTGEFKTISEWYLWQAKELYLKEFLESKVTLGTTSECGDLIEDAGNGVCKITHDEFSLNGTLNGEEISLTLPLEKIAGFPITVGVHFDIYYQGKLIYVYPEPNRASSIQWVAYLDEALKRKK